MDLYTYREKDKFESISHIIKQEKLQKDLKFEIKNTESIQVLEINMNGFLHKPEIRKTFLP